MSMFCIAHLHSPVPDAAEVARALDALTGTVLQRHPVKPKPQSRAIYGVKLLEYDPERHFVRFWISCETGINVRSHCTHLGLLLGVGAHMEDLREVRSGCLGEKDNMITISEVRYAHQLYDDDGNEIYLRKIVMSVEVLLVNYKRLVVRNSVIYALCHGEKLMIPGLVRFENYIEKGEKIVMMTAKGEAIGIGLAKMTSAEMSTSDSGCLIRTTVIFLEADIVLMAADMPLLDQVHFLVTAGLFTACLSLGRGLWKEAPS
ncbi:H/ACA ribonucleoprotein complex subunit 4 [Platanthera zijinensis]|uniref:H/ACA ribonucleoprotein complex subunit 4 n=1 Tax=Platanthera zijinensis TaxID=2320716 RepID=A0AAP0BL81_9ASPA